MSQDQEIQKRKLHSNVQNALSDLADDNFSAILVSVIKSDGSMDTLSYGDIDKLCFLNSMNNTMISRALNHLLNENK